MESGAEKVYEDSKVKLADTAEQAKALAAVVADDIKEKVNNAQVLAKEKLGITPETVKHKATELFDQA